MKKQKSAVSKFRVFIEQVNQSVVEVTAATPEEAGEKAYRKWRRDYAHARVSEVSLA